MKIGIYHNLKPGGGLSYIYQLASVLKKENEITFFSFQPNRHRHKFKSYKYIKLKKTRNVFSHLIQVMFELKRKSQYLARIINKENFDLFIVNNDYLTQSPYILRYLNNTKTIYITHEPKREFYEKTSFDHFSIKRTIAQIIRYPIKLIDIRNCKSANWIITNSFYSKSIFKKIYKKNSYVLYPGLTRTKYSDIQYTHGNSFISFGNFSYTKGHQYSIETIKNLEKQRLLIVGEKNNDFNYINNLSLLYKNITILTNISEKNKKHMLTTKSAYFCFQINEPFGISTLEIANDDNFIYGFNKAGTCEITQHGINSILVPQNKLYLVQDYIKQKYPSHYSNNSHISWNDTSKKLLQLYHFLKNEPTY